jgi:hypothetical protein
MSKLARLAHHQLSPRQTTIAFMLCIFVISRFAYWRTGIRFDDSTLPWFWQFLDVPLLREQLLDSCFHLHSQPPGFNFFLGAVVNLLPGHTNAVFHVCFLFCGLIIYFSLYAILLKMGMKNTAAAVFSSLFIVTPCAILYENLLFYTYPTSALLLFSSIWFMAFARSGAIRHALVFFLLVAAVCYTRSLFHLVYLIACVGLCVIFRPRAWRAVGLAASPAIVLVAVLYLKNAILFGFFGTSSWLGINLWHSASRHVPIAEFQKMAESGELTEAIPGIPFRAVTNYPASFAAVPARFAEIPALTGETKQSGHPNFNHYAYIRVGREYMNVSRIVISRNPRSYFCSIADACLIYLSPYIEDSSLHKNAERIAPLVSIWTKFTQWIPVNLSPGYRLLFGKDVDRVYPLIQLLLLPSILLVSMVLMVRKKLLVGLQVDQARTACGFALFTILYVTVVGNLFDYGENHRFRILTMPLYVVLFSLCVERVVYRVTTGRRNARFAS